MSEHAYHHVTRETDPDEQVAVTSGGVTVEKAAELYEDDVAKVVFTVRSDADERRMLHLADEVPAGIDAETVGFHPDYHPEHWQVSDDGRVVYESAVEPGTSFETLYGVRIASADELSLFDEEPSVEARPLLSSESENAEPEERPPDAGGSDPDEEVVETFIDEHGSGEQLLERFRAEMAEQQTDIEALEETLESFAGELTEVQCRLERLAEVEATLGRFEDELLTVRQSHESTKAELDARIQRLDDRLDELATTRETSLAAMEEELHEVRDELDREREWRQNLRGAIGVEPTPFEYQ